MTYSIIHYIRSTELSASAKKRLKGRAETGVANKVYSVVSFIPLHTNRKKNVLYLKPVSIKTEIYSYSTDYGKRTKDRSTTQEMMP